MIGLAVTLLEIYKKCEALKPGGPLTTRQPAKTLVNVG